MECVKEITIEELCHSYDWASVFGEDNQSNCNAVPEACPPEAPVDLTKPARTDVAEVLAAVNGENDGADWVGVFRLKDGRFLVAQGGCDYTGWD